MFKRNTHILQTVLQLCAGIIVVVVLALSLVGKRGNLTENELRKFPVKGSTVFELSPERGRFALTYAIVEKSSFFLTRDLAQFASPDVGYHNGKYVSIFAPLLSVFLVPGYVLGKFFGSSHVGAGVIIALAALANVALIRAISIKLKAHPIAGTIAGLIFVFATPSFPYAINLYQHHVSTLFLLTSFYLYISSSSWLALAGIFFLSGLSIPLDYPNAFLMFPIALAACGKIVRFDMIKDTISMRISPKLLTSMCIVLIPLGMFMYFNSLIYGDPFTLSGTVQTLTFDDPSGTTSQDLTAIPINKEIEEQIDKNGTRSVDGFFQTRNMLNGLFILFVSPDRGLLVYAPLMLLGLFGSILLIKKSSPHVPLMLGIIGVNVVLYAMWGDPWGGWAFGSRYMIPSYALISILLALEMTKLRYSTAFVSIMLLLVNYSVAVNALGALTSIAIPPQVQVLELEKLSGIIQKYTFTRSYDLLLKGKLSSFIYQSFLSNHISSVSFYALIVIPIMSIIALLTLYLYQHHSRSDTS